MNFGILLAAAVGTAVAARPGDQGDAFLDVRKVLEQDSLSEPQTFTSIANHVLKFGFGCTFEYWIKIPSTASAAKPVFNETREFIMFGKWSFPAKGFANQEEGDAFYCAIGFKPPGSNSMMFDLVDMGIAWYSESAGVGGLFGAYTVKPEVPVPRRGVWTWEATSVEDGTAVITGTRLLRVDVSSAVNIPFPAKAYDGSWHGSVVTVIAAGGSGNVTDDDAASSGGAKAKTITVARHRKSAAMYGGVDLAVGPLSVTATPDEVVSNFNLHFPFGCSLHYKIVRGNDNVPTTPVPVPVPRPRPAPAPTRPRPGPPVRAALAAADDADADGGWSAANAADAHNDDGAADVAAHGDSDGSGLASAPAYYLVAEWSFPTRSYPNKATNPWEAIWCGTGLRPASENSTMYGPLDVAAAWWAPGISRGGILEGYTTRPMRIAPRSGGWELLSVTVRDNRALVRGRRPLPSAATVEYGTSIPLPVQTSRGATGYAGSAVTMLAAGGYGNASLVDGVVTVALGKHVAAYPYGRIDLAAGPVSYTPTPSPHPEPPVVPAPVDSDVPHVLSDRCSVAIQLAMPGEPGPAGVPPAAVSSPSVVMTFTVKDSLRNAYCAVGMKSATSFGVMEGHTDVIGVMVGSDGVPVPQLRHVSTYTQPAIVDTKALVTWHVEKTGDASTVVVSRPLAAVDGLSVAVATPVGPVGSRKGSLAMFIYASGPAVPPDADPTGPLGWHRHNAEYGGFGVIGLLDIASGGRPATPFDPRIAQLAVFWGGIACLVIVSILTANLDPALRHARGALMLLPHPFGAFALDQYIFIAVAFGVCTASVVVGLHFQPDIVQSRIKVAGILAASALGTAAIPVTRHGPLHALMKTSFDRASYVHRVFGVLLLGAVALHVAAVVAYVPDFLTTLAPQRLITGGIGAFAITAIVATSILDNMRRAFYRVWVVIHVLGYIAALVACLLHDNVTIFALAPSLILVTIDLFMRFSALSRPYEILFAGLVPATTLSAAAVSPWSHVLLIIGVPDSFTVRGGQFVTVAVNGFLRPLSVVGGNAFHAAVSEVSLLTVQRGSHPMETEAAHGSLMAGIASPHAVGAVGPETFASRRHIVLMGKIVGPGTRALADRAAKSVGSRIRLDGPFGQLAVSARGATHIVLFAGGVGITPLAGILAEIRGSPHAFNVKRVTLVWTFREIGMLRALYPFLQLPDGLESAFHPHYTGDVRTLDTVDDGRLPPYNTTRPDIPAVLMQEAQIAAVRGTDIAVCVCGPATFAAAVGASVIAAKANTGVSFQVHFEAFQL